MEVGLKILGQNIQTSRLNRKITQKELAARCGVSIRTLSDIERGKILPSLDLLLALEKYFEPKKARPQSASVTETTNTLDNVLGTLPFLIKLLQKPV